MDETVKAELEDAVEQSPTELDYNFTRRTVPKLATHIAKTLRTELSRETIRQALAEGVHSDFVGDDRAGSSLVKIPRQLNG